MNKWRSDFYSQRNMLEVQYVRFGHLLNEQFQQRGEAYHQVNW